MQNDFIKKRSFHGTILRKIVLYAERFSYICGKYTQMESVTQIYTRLLAVTPMDHFRYLYRQINWEDRLISITGVRGAGKTILLLQYIKENFPDKRNVLYASLDNIWFTRNTLTDLVEQFTAYGGTHLFLDEVHRYPNWCIEIKNIYDSYPGLHIVFTGSSMLEIFRSNADLSRRAINYHLYGLSFREFLEFETGKKYPCLSLEEILSDHINIAANITQDLKILPLFKTYLEHGYYPFYKEGIKSYPIRLQNIVNTTLDYDLPAIENIEYATILKLKKMLMLLSSLVPFTPNMTSLSADIETNRASAMRYLNILEKAALITMLLPAGKTLNLMNKPEKIYLANSNLLQVLSTSPVNAGNQRETFFANQVKILHQINSSKKGDFIVDNKYTFEIGGKNKNYNQIKDVENSYIASDEIETGFGNRIPLWLFGMLY